MTDLQYDGHHQDGGTIIGDEFSQHGNDDVKGDQQQNRAVAAEVDDLQSKPVGGPCTVQGIAQGKGRADGDQYR